MSDIRKKKKITSEYRKLWYYEMLYGTLKYHEPPIRLAKYEIDSHIFMHQVQGNNYTYEMAIKDFGKRKVDLLLSNGLIEKENGLMIDKRVIENVEEVLDKSIKRTEAANSRWNKEKENKEINNDANAMLYISNHIIIESQHIKIILKKYITHSGFKRLYV